MQGERKQAPLGGDHRPGRTRVQPRTHPKSLAGMPISRDQLEAVYLKLEQELPPRWHTVPLCDLLAHAFMLGIVEAARTARPTPDTSQPGGGGE